MQGPQDYRDAGQSLFKAMAYEEYRGFFHIGMVERNEHNAIIQHGTMTIVRKDALEEVGGWSEWCITEDTELGLKLFEAGYEAAYVPQSMGSGLMPDTLEAFMTQRYRWVYGAMQMLKRHAGAIFLGGSALSWPQRYQFLSGWLPWISDGLGMMVTLMAHRLDRADVGDAQHDRRADAGAVGGGDGAVRHQADQDPAALSAQGGLRRERRLCRLGGGPVADPHGGQGGVERAF